MLKINNIKMQIKSTKNDLKNKLEKLLKNEIKKIKIIFFMYILLVLN